MSTEETVIAPNSETVTTIEENKITVPEVKTETKKEESAKTEEPKWYIDVITGLRHNVRDTKAENEALKAENEALKAGEVTEPAKTPENLTDSEINRRAAELADVRVFNEKCDSIAEKGNQEFPTFKTALANLHAVGALGPNVSPAFLQTVAELPEAHKLLNHLGNNPDEAARIASLPSVKMALELAKIEAALGKPKEVSKAPAPIKTVSGNGGNSGDLADPALSMEEFSKIREKQRAERAKR